MLVIQTMLRVRGMPVPVVLGVLLVVVGGVADVVMSVMAAGHHTHVAASAQHVPHLVAITGMTLVLAGVVTHGARRHRRRRPAAISYGGLDHDAHR